jgi:hypothetical protein
MSKVCSRCRRELALESFAIRRDRKTPYKNYCKACDSAMSKERYARSPEGKEKRKQGMRARTLAQYGLTPESYLELYNRQHGFCAICREDALEDSLNVDHCHVTGKVRGLLCGRCNKGLGLFQDSPLLLRLAAEYLTDSEEA